MFGYAGANTSNAGEPSVKAIVMIAMILLAGCTIHLPYSIWDDCCAPDGAEEPKK